MILYIIKTMSDVYKYNQAVQHFRRDLNDDENLKNCLMINITLNLLVNIMIWQHLQEAFIQEIMIMTIIKTKNLNLLSDMYIIINY